MRPAGTQAGRRLGRAFESLRTILGSWRAQINTESDSGPQAPDESEQHSVAGWRWHPLAIASEQRIEVVEAGGH